MTLRGSGPSAYIYIGTENGIYRIPTADCGRLTDCCSCVSARDPYCMYDLSSFKCVAMASTDSNRAAFLQDYTQGNSNLCTAMATESSNSAAPSGGDGCSSSGTETAAVETSNEREGSGVSTAIFSTSAVVMF